MPEPALDDLRERLARTRFPDEPPLEPWATGTSLSYLKDLVGYWQAGFDWRAQEARLNRFAQYKVAVGGTELHFIHEPGRGARPMPLLLMHGWPGSVWEFHQLIPLLTEHFTVVAPSLPGFTLSYTPGQPRFGSVEMAEVFAELMSVLGYRKFGAQGGDWGASIATRLGYAFAERLIGIHLNMLSIRRDPDIVAATPEEAAYARPAAQLHEGGNRATSGSRARSRRPSPTASPTHRQGWRRGSPRNFAAGATSPISRDDLLANVSLYWFTGAIGSSFWPYYARMHQGWPIPAGKTIDVPDGLCRVPEGDSAAAALARRRRPTRGSSAGRSMKKGGHFAALEQPDALAEEIKAFFG